MRQSNLETRHDCAHKEEEEDDDRIRGTTGALKYIQKPLYPQLWYSLIKLRYDARERER
jgi:hypothetical protein